MKYAFLAFICLLGFQSPAFGNPTPGAVCDFQFEAQGTDIQIVIGYSKLKGAGKISCKDNVTAKVEELPFTITIGTPVFFPRVSFAPSLTVKGGASGIQVLKGGPSVLLDQYVTLDVRAVIGGAGFAKFLELEGQTNGLTFKMGLEDIEGFGIAVGGTVVTLK